MEPGTRQLETVPMPQTLLKLFKLVSFELAYPFTHFFPRERLAYLFAWLLPPLTDPGCSSSTWQGMPPSLGNSEHKSFFNGDHLLTYWPHHACLAVKPIF